MGESCTLGKDAGNDLVVDDRFISGRHLRIGRKGSHFVLVDQASTNGTWLGPVRVFEAEVPLNTTVRVGETDVVLEPWTSPRRGRTRRPLAGDHRARIPRSACWSTWWSGWRRRPRR